ncbi:hypothetical protein MMC16_005014 [Acarospora aff. strigata]|nr:hypothetical protein [Acarospora aff. strigata]
MTFISNETAVAIVFGIIMTIVGIGAWFDSRRRSLKRSSDPEDCELTRQVRGRHRRGANERNQESSSEARESVRARAPEHQEPAELEA